MLTPEGVNSKSIPCHIDYPSLAMELAYRHPERFSNFVIVTAIRFRPQVIVPV